MHPKYSPPEKPDLSHGSRAFCAPFRPAASTLQPLCAPLFVFDVQHFEKSENLRPNTYLCIIKTKLLFTCSHAERSSPPPIATEHPTHRSQTQSTTHSLTSQNLHTMIYNAFEALKAFYRTTVVPLHFGKHRTFNLHTLPALLLIPYLI